MAKRDSAFSLLELLVTVAIIGVIAATALPSAISALQAYHLHSDASAVAGSFNVARLRAASQYAPYALDVNNTVTPSTFVIEALAGATYNPLNPSATGAYASQSPQVFDSSGMQYASQGTTFAFCRPAGITAYPGPVKADPTSCTGPSQFCFNTRGLPVQCASGTPGAPLTTASGGQVLYLQNGQGLTDAITIAVGGVVQVWNWDSVGATWYLR